MARSATFRRPVRVELANDDRTNPVWACNGTPVDCVRVALLTTLAEPVQLVISGANQGANLGDDATYSSTVGAAIEGALLGLPAMAISQQSADGRFLLVDRAGHDLPAPPRWRSRWPRRCSLIRHHTARSSTSTSPAMP